MAKIPILFLEDDPELISIYKCFLETHDYSVIVIRNGLSGIDQAISETPSFLTLKVAEFSMNSPKRRLPVIIITHDKVQKNNKFEIESAVYTGKIFKKIKKVVESEKKKTSRCIDELTKLNLK